MPSKAKIVKKNPRLLFRGDVVRFSLPSGGDPVEDVVRSIDIIVHLANGQDVTVSADEDIDTLDDSALSERLLQQLSDIQEAFVPSERE